MFEVLKLLRDINTLRRIHWEIKDGIMHVQIPVSEDDAKFVEDMQRLFEPVDEFRPDCNDRCYGEACIHTT